MPSVLQWSARDSNPVGTIRQLSNLVVTPRPSLPGHFAAGRAIQFSNYQPTDECYSTLFTCAQVLSPNQIPQSFPVFDRGK